MSAPIKPLFVIQGDPLGHLKRPDCQPATMRLWNALEAQDEREILAACTDGAEFTEVVGLSYCEKMVGKTPYAYCRDAKLYSLAVLLADPPNPFGDAVDPEKLWDGLMRRHPLLFVPLVEKVGITPKAWEDQLYWVLRTNEVSDGEPLRWLDMVLAHDPSPTHPITVAACLDALAELGKQKEEVIESALQRLAHKWPSLDFPCWNEQGPNFSIDEVARLGQLSTQTFPYDNLHIMISDYARARGMGEESNIAHPLILEVLVRQGLRLEVVEEQVTLLRSSLHPHAREWVSRFNEVELAHAVPQAIRHKPGIRL